MSVAVLILVFHCAQLLLITLFLSVELEQLQVESEREKMRERAVEICGVFDAIEGAKDQSEGCGNLCFSLSFFTLQLYYF